ncbi:MAG TPA: hypothetical protein VHO03_01350 [Ignavibacteriales bacterium]|nr:hypothetical protein [Ignavibacteriales bacterium]
MNRTINITPVKILASAALILILGFAAYGQDSTRISVPPTPSIGHGQVISAAQDTFFNLYAARFAVSLAQQTGLSLDKASKIRDILLDYYNSISSTRQSFIRSMIDSSNAGSTAPNPDVTGSRKANREAITRDLMSEYHKADLKADEDIMDVFDSHAQKVKYVEVKRQWWQKVKNVVFSTANMNSGGVKVR